MNSHLFTRVAFVLLLVTSLIFSIATRGVAADKYVLPDAAEDITPVKTGQRAPHFTVRDVDNNRYQFDPNNLQNAAVLISFRGGWCPYCNMHLSELRHVIPEITAAGIDVLFLSGDRPELLYASLEDKTQEDIGELGYTILSDADLAAAAALGTAFRASDRVKARRIEKGQDIAGSSLEQFGALAVPAVFVVNKSGEVVFSYVNADYKVRLPADDLKAAALSTVGR